MKVTFENFECGLSDRFKIDKVTGIGWDYSDSEPIGKVVDIKTDGTWTVNATKKVLNKIYGIPYSLRFMPDSMEIYDNKQKRTTNMKIKNVIFNDPATIVFWADGTKTVVKCQDGDIFDPEKGLAMAISKKALGTNKSKGNFNDVFKKWL